MSARIKRNYHGEAGVGFVMGRNVLGLRSILKMACTGILFFGLPLFAQAQTVTPGDDQETVQQPGQPSSGDQNTATPTVAPTQKPDQLPDTIQAPPFTVADKFDYRVVQAFGLKGFVGAGLGAAIGQVRDAPHEWGEGAGGFTKRYVSGFAGNFSRQVFASTLETAFHEDPRYFPSEDRPLKERFINAMKQTVFTRKDNGGDSFAYARVISAFATGQLVNAWQPPSSSSVGEGFKRSFITLGADAGYNLLQEFFPFTRPISLRHRH